MKEISIPDKPADVTWTDDQWKAIMSSGQDILVAAAAGSGKTAVLVERMIRKIVSDQPINVDELLVVTFTNASAAEMKHRIGEVLEKEINANPTSQHLKRQLALLNKAHISTIHSFCLEVIRKYYYVIDLDPGFRIADETEGQLLRDECLEDLFEEEYGKENNVAFFDLVDAFTNDRSDDALQRMIQEIYDFSRSNPFPSAYLQSLIKMYAIGEDADIMELPFVKHLIDDVELQLEGVRKLLEYGYELTKLPGGPAPRASNFLEDLELVSILEKAKAQSWETLYEAMQKLKFSRAKPCKGDDYDPSLVEEGQRIRERAKKILQEMQGDLFTRKPQSFLKDMAEMKPHVETLVYLVEAFGERFQQIKMDKGLVDFADLEHYCLSILSRPEENELIPSEAALFYRAQFKEVLIDEYQDVNLVQESILKLVTKDRESEGNLFMVGDVKQSIYRFRLAEPNLFLAKYLRFQEREDAGFKIDLAKNFRSRKEVLEGTNFLFKQIMGVKVGEIEYDESAELKLGASYPEENSYPIEVALVNQSADSSEDSEIDGETTGIDAAELEQSQLEARVIAEKVKELLETNQEVYDAKLKAYRPIRYKDMVILLRSMTWAPQIMEELKQYNIPTYANLTTGYFESTEVDIMMSLLKVIDNPYQDIPLASVLRSPIVGLSEEELSKLRIAKKQGAFYEAIQVYIHMNRMKEEELYEKIRPFFDKLAEWRSEARRGALSELIWKLYRETYFYDFVGGLPAGNQRQANLRALYDRARQYEETSFRGLFRFLRFVERMRDRGNDLGAARALTEQEDVIRIMTIHSSKGLEFPFVFMAGMGRNFNTMDLRKNFLLDKDLGFATKYIDAKKRISYPSLPQIAFSKKKKMELLAEEMRVLYVALTRAKEKLILIGAVKDIEKAKQKWSQIAGHSNWLLNEFDRAQAKSYLDWIGPALVRHRDNTWIHLESWSEKDEISSHPSNWEVKVLQKEELLTRSVEEEIKDEEWLNKIVEGKKIESSSVYKEAIKETFAWSYSSEESTSHRSKQSVSELKRQGELRDAQSGTELVKAWKQTVWNRPRFMQEKKLSPAEIGTAMHMVMQHVDVKAEVTEASLKQLLEEMVRKELLTSEQVEVIDISSILSFFQSSLGKRMQQAPKLVREIPFNIAYPASRVYADWSGEEEPVLVQGIIDVFFEDELGTVLLDYKTDTITARYKGGYEEAKPILESRYKIQMELYTEALEKILKRNIEEKYLFFFDGGQVLEL
ncbi:helicase-exonuclease AddAB subunit AddA [Niallia sp. Sow4_A1]|uniref:ATP-dependent helicase/nuclease subunit A n=1 Tax=Niallia hominis TaxID=3133173 RepID=A0ABV1ETV4_9BACI|nr:MULTISPECIES: helicase-exonuclease AddAB subunit AddA [unclassified Bacillus (in: firmicutes)]REB73263.1 helicase-exonuclease AddAB subunit AddA [Cutibacterium acnes]